MLDFRLLTFLDLCHSKSYTKTAERLNITQPAVSQHIKYLEQYYGVKLILYQNRHFSLTKEGEYLLKEITRLNLLSNSIRQNIQEISEAQDLPTISIGSNPTIGEFILPGLISSYTMQEPSCRIRSIIDSSEQLARQIRSGSIDFLITDKADFCPEFERHLFCKERICCICNPHHPLAGQSVTLAQLSQEKIIYRERTSHAYRVLQKSFKRLGYNLDAYDIPFETGSMYSIIQYLKEREAISFLYRCAVKEYLGTGELAEILIPEMQECVDFYCIYPQTIHTSHVTEDFLRFCLEQHYD